MIPETVLQCKKNSCYAKEENPISTSSLLGQCPTLWVILIKVPQDHLLSELFSEKHPHCHYKQYTLHRQEKEKIPVKVMKEIDASTQLFTADLPCTHVSLQPTLWSVSILGDFFGIMITCPLGSFSIVHTTYTSIIQYFGNFLCIFPYLSTTRQIGWLFT